MIENNSMFGFDNTSKEKSVTEKFNIKQAFKSSNQILSHVGNLSILGNFEKEKNDNFGIKTKTSKKICLSKNSVNTFNSLINEDKSESDSQNLNDDSSINNIVNEVKKENDSSFYYDEEAEKEDEEEEDEDEDKDRKKVVDKNKDKEKDKNKDRHKDGDKDRNKDKDKDKNKDEYKEKQRDTDKEENTDKVKEKYKNKDLNEINNKNKDNNMLKDKEIHFNSINNLKTFEEKKIDIQKGNKYNNNQLTSENTITKVYLDEELKKINQKFDKLKEEANEKIMEIADKINVLINKINSLSFNKESANKIKETRFSAEKNKNKIILSNSGVSLPMTSNFSRYYTSIKADKDKVNKISFKNKEIYNNKLNCNIFNINPIKISNLRTYSNDRVLTKNRADLNKNYIKILNLNSVNKIEKYLIKKFTDSN